MDHQLKFGDKVYHHLFKNGVIALVEDELTHVSFVLQDEHPFHCTFLNVPQKGSRDTSELHPVSDWIEIDWDDESTWPELNQKVLAFDGDGTIHSCLFGEHFDSEEVVFLHENVDGMEANFIWHVTHWQPLPQLPMII